MWKQEIINGRPPRSETMTGLAGWQVAELVVGVHALLGGWQRPKGRRKSLGLYRAVVLTLFLLRQNTSQAVAGELFGCSQPTVSRIFRKIWPLFDQITANRVDEVVQQARRSAVLVDGLIAPTGERSARDDLFSKKHHVCGMNVQVVANLNGRVLDTGTPIGGSRHDSVAFVESGIAERWATHMLLEGPGLSGDKGYQGTGANTPYKKPQGSDLTEPRKSCNHSHSSIRAAVERAISHLTNWRILDIGYRGRLSEFPEILRTVTNLEIYRVWA